jgi:hypothetical protein
MGENESDDDDDDDDDGNDECGRGRVARDDDDECATPRRSSMRWRVSDDDDFIAVAMRGRSLLSSFPLLFFISISPSPLVPSAYLTILVFHPSYSYQLSVFSSWWISLSVLKMSVFREVHTYDKMWDGVGAEDWTGELERQSSRERPARYRIRQNPENF